jgi:outer membrane protein assembly factor BamB
MNKRAVMKARIVNWRLAWILGVLALVLIAATGVTIIRETTGNVSKPKIPQVVSKGVTSEDWPTYLHDPEHSAASNDKILSPSNAARLTKLWSFNTGDAVAPSPAIVGNIVYVGSWNGYEYALDANTGAVKWKTYLGKTTPPHDCSPTHAGISSGAAVQDGVVYVGGGDAYWYALDAKTGKTLWKIYTGDNSATAGHYNWASPLLYKGYAYIGIASFGDCPLVQGQVLKVSLKTHKVVNTLNLVPDRQAGAGVWTSPTLDPVTNTIYITTGTESFPSQKYAQAFVALNADTLQITDSWKLPESVAVHDSDFGTTPTLFTDAAGNRMVVAIDKNGYAYAFKEGHLSAGPVWQQLIAVGGDCPLCGDGSVASGAFARGTLYLGGGNGLVNGTGYPGSVRALDPATGTFLWQHGTSGHVIGALAYSNGLILDGAGSTFEVLDASNGKRLYSYQTGGTIYGAPSIARGKVYFGSFDGGVYAFGLPSTAPAQPPADAHCPPGWSCQAIGAPKPAGAETSSNNSWEVTAGGAGAAGFSDHFRLMAQTVSGDTQITAHIVSQQAPGGGNAQTGLMVRQDNTPGSPYYAVFYSSGTGVVVQYRAAFGGGTTTITQQTRAGLPLYLEIQRIGDLFQAATSTNGTTYTLVPNGTTTLTLPTKALVGLAASSGKNGAASTATYKAVTIQAPTTQPRALQSTATCPAGWNCRDFGNPALLGSQSLRGGVWTIQAGGSDIWDTWDQFHYVWQSLSGDGRVSTHIAAQTRLDPWAKAGVMLRDGAGPNSAYYAVLVTPGNGIQVQYRTIQGASTKTIAAISGAAPVYLQVRRSGNTFTAYISRNGTTWTLIKTSRATLDMSHTLLAGMVVTSHQGHALCTVTFDAVQFNRG